MLAIHRFFSFLVLSFVFVLIGNTLHAQATGNVSGKIRDAAGIYLPGVNVIIKGTTTGTITDENGKFILSIPSNEEIVIQISYIGFSSENISVRVLPGETKNLNVRMRVDSKTLDGVVIAETINRSENLMRIDAKALQVMPNPSGNIESILKTLPGVSSNNELSSQYNVRGGNYDENLVYVNDVEIYRPFLIRSGQQEGLSFVNSDLVSSLSFSAGGFDAKYGDKMSSVLDIKYLKPIENGGFAAFSVQGGSIALYGTNPKKNWSGIFGVRQKSSSYVLKSLDTQGEYKPSFTDVQTCITHTPNEKWEFSFLGNYARNRYQIVPSTRETEFGTINEALRLTIYFEGQEVDKYETMLGAFTFKNTPNDKLTLKYIVSGFNTYESETFDILAQYRLDELEKDIGKPQFGDVAFNRGAGTHLIHARNTLDASVANIEHKGKYDLGNHVLEWGIKGQQEIIRDKIKEYTMIDSSGYSLPHSQDSAGYTDPEAQTKYPLELTESIATKINLNNSRYTAFIQNTYTRSDSARFSLTIGARVNYLSYTKDWVGGPRGSVSYKPRWKRRTIVRASSGYYYQPPFYKEMRDTKGVIHSSIRAQRSIHFVLGMDYFFKAWNRPFKYVIEAYYKILDDLVPYKIDNVRIRYLGKNNATGYARGVDMRVNGEFVKGIESWASISFLQTQEDLSDDFYLVNYNSDGEKIINGYTRNDEVVRTDTVNPGLIPRPADQRITFGLFFQDYLPKFPSYKMHLALLFGSGLPFGPPGLERWKDILRMPPYRRVDIGFSKEILGGNSRWNPKGKLWNRFTNIWLSVEVFNLLQVSNTVSYLWVTDVTDRNYAVPNYLTARQLNVRLNVKF